MHITYAFVKMWNKHLIIVSLSLYIPVYGFYGNFQHKSTQSFSTSCLVRGHQLVLKIAHAKYVPMTFACFRSITELSVSALTLNINI